MTKYLTADAGRAVQPRRFKDVQLPVNGGTVRIRSWKAEELRLFKLKMQNPKKPGALSAEAAFMENLVIADCWCDENGDPVITHEEAKSYFSGWDAVDMATLYSACADWCGLNNDVDFQAIADEIKNSRQIPGGNSSCGSD